MTKPEFWEIFFLNSELYIVIAFGVFSLSFIFFKLLGKSVYHPVLFYIFFNYQFALVAVIFLDRLGYIDDQLSSYFYWAQICFWLGFFIVCIMNGVFSRPSCQEAFVFQPSRGFRFAYKYSFQFYLFLSVLSFLLFGFPAFTESKWSVYSSIPLAGIIGRILTVLPYFIIVCLVVTYVALGRFRNFDLLVLFFLLLFGLLSGSKIFFLKYFFIAYLAYVALLGFANKVNAASSFSRHKFFIVLGFLASFILVGVVVYYHQLYTRSVSANPFILILQRLIMSGDMQILVLPNAVVENLNYGEGVFSIIFYELKGFLSFLGFNISGPSIGIKAMIEHYPDWHVNIGPASTFDIFSYVYFKDFALLFCFFVGVFIGYITVFRLNPRNEAFLILQIMLIVGGYTLVYNPQIWVSETVFNLIFFFAFYFFIKIRLLVNVRS